MINLTEFFDQYGFYVVISVAGIVVLILLLTIMKNKRRKLLEEEKENNKKLKRDEKGRFIKDYTNAEIKDITLQTGFNYTHLKDWLVRRFKKNTLILINMELINGLHTSFIISHDAGKFLYKGGTYALDNTAKYYNLAAQMYAFDFHEAFSLPIKRSIPLKEIKDSVIFSEISEVELATNPTTLEQLINSNIAEGILKGQQISEWMSRVKIFIILTMAICGVHLVLYIIMSDVLGKLGVGG